MSVFLKILSILIVAAGAFLVYGAGFLTKKTLAGNADTDTKNLDTENGSSTGLSGNNSEQEEYILQKTLSFKRTGLLLIMLGSILVLIAFKQ